MNVGKSQFTALKYILGGVLSCLLLVTAQPSPAAIVWTGPLFTFNQPAPNPKQATNQDRITPDVWLTRAASKGLFNAFFETNATAFSPTNTEWAFGTLANYASLNYTNWLALLNGASPTTLVGQPLVVHLISDDIYLSLKITFWGAGGSGGFTYERSTLEPVINLVTIGIDHGQFVFTGNTIAGQSYVIQGSTNLLDWIPLATNLASGSSLMFTNATDQSGVGFYRVGRLSAP